VLVTAKFIDRKPSAHRGSSAIRGFDVGALARRAGEAENHALGPANPGNVGSAETALTSQTVWKRNPNLSQQIAALDAKLERMWLDLDFIELG
jgi:hypothetical protein